MMGLKGTGGLRERMSLAGPPVGLRFVAVVSLAIWGVLAFIFWRQLSIHIRFMNDAFVFFDGIHRVGKGQIPHVDFSTPVGALAYWLPYLGFEAIGGYAGAVEVASLMLCAVTLAIATVLLAGRVSAAAAILCLATISGIIVVPLIPGWTPSEITGSMHYNRWGWGLLLPVFLLALAPSGGAPASQNGILRGLCGGVLIVALFYVKITYFIFALAFLPVLGLYPDQRRRDAVVALVAAIVLLFISFLAVPGLIPSYLADILQAISAAASATRDSYLDHAFANRQAVILLILAGYAAFLSGQTGWRDLAVSGYILAASLAIIDQNFQFEFLVALPAVFALLATNRAKDTQPGRMAGSVILAAGFFMVLPYALDWARVSVRYISPPSKGTLLVLEHPDYQNVYFGGREAGSADADPSSHVALDADAYLRGEISILTVSEKDYLETLMEGMDLLKANVPAGSVIVTFDYSNTLAPLADAPREPVGLSWIHLGRNVGPDSMPPASRYFSGVDFVMVPKASRFDTASRLLGLYGNYMLDNMDVVEQSDSWILLSVAAQN